MPAIGLLLLSESALYHLFGAASKNMCTLLCHLSCPDRLLCMALQRPQRVKVRAQSVKGETLMLTLTDWQARIFQHEYDHLQVCAAPVLPSSESFSAY